MFVDKSILCKIKGKNTDGDSKKQGYIAVIYKIKQFLLKSTKRVINIMNV